MENSPQPLAGLDPRDLLRQGAAEDTFVGNTGEPFNPPSIDELAPLFSQFEFLEMIGKGGMGAVYKVRQKELDRVVALKILPPSIGEQGGFSQRFAREAKALAKLNHPGIVTIHEFGQQEGLFFIVMEFVDGVNLRQLMRSGRISAREALAIVPQICDSLQFAHDQGIVHRDIKPENILLDRLGRVKVADFGIAKLVGADDPASAGGVPGEPWLTEAGKVMGTPQYMAPEQVEHPSGVDHRADIYALGVVFYQMLTGELPDKQIEVPSKKVRIDVRLDEVVLQALESDPERRFQTAVQFKTAVDDLHAPARGLPVARPSPPPARERGMFRRWWWVFPAMVPVGVLLGLVGGMIWADLVPKKYEVQTVVEIKAPAGESGQSRFFATQFEVLKSRQLLGAVAGELELSRRWNVGEENVIQILKGTIQAQSIRGTDLVGIRVRNTNPDEALAILDALVSNYQEKAGLPVLVHEKDVSPGAPVSPNVLLLLALGSGAGLVASPLMALLLIVCLHLGTKREEEVGNKMPGLIWSVVPVAAILLAVFNPWGSKAWVIFGIVCMVVALFPGLFGAIASGGNGKTVRRRVAAFMAFYGVALLFLSWKTTWRKSDRGFPPLPPVAVREDTKLFAETIPVVAETPAPPTAPAAPTVIESEEPVPVAAMEETPADDVPTVADDGDGAPTPDEVTAEARRIIDARRVVEIAEQYLDLVMGIEADIASGLGEKHPSRRAGAKSLEELKKAHPSLPDIISMEMASQRAVDLEMKIAALKQSGLADRHPSLAVPTAQVAALRKISGGLPGPVEKETAAREEAAPPVETLVEVFADGTVTMDEQVLDLTRLEERIKLLTGKNKNVAVRIRGASGARYEQIVRVLDVCSRADAWNVTFASRPPLPGDQELEEKIQAKDLPPGNRVQIRKVQEDPAAEKMDLARPDGSTEALQISPEVIVCDRHIQQAGMRKDGDGYHLTITLDQAGAARMAEGTKGAAGTLRLAVIVDGKIRSAPVVQTQLGASFEISGFKSSAECVELLGNLQTWKDADAADALPWLALLDSGDPAGSYSGLAGRARTALTGEQWKLTMEQYRQPLGKKLSRRADTVRNVKSVPGMPDGNYRLVTFDSDFENKKGVKETVSLLQEEDGAWKPVAYSIK